MDIETILQLSDIGMTGVVIYLVFKQQGEIFNTITPLVLKFFTMRQKSEDQRWSALIEVLNKMIHMNNTDHKTINNVLQLVELIRKDEKINLDDIF